MQICRETMLKALGVAVGDLDGSYTLNSRLVSALALFLPWHEFEKAELDIFLCKMIHPVPTMVTSEDPYAEVKQYPAPLRAQAAIWSLEAMHFKNFTDRADQDYWEDVCRKSWEDVCRKSWEYVCKNVFALPNDLALIWNLVGEVFGAAADSNTRRLRDALPLLKSVVDAFNPLDMGWTLSGFVLLPGIANVGSNLRNQLLPPPRSVPGCSDSVFRCLQRVSAADEIMQIDQHFESSCVLRKALIDRCRAYEDGASCCDVGRRNNASCGHALPELKDAAKMLGKITTADKPWSAWVENMGFTSPKQVQTALKRRSYSISAPRLVMLNRGYKGNKVEYVLNSSKTDAPLIRFLQLVALWYLGNDTELVASEGIGEVIKPRNIPRDAGMAVLKDGQYAYDRTGGRVVFPTVTIDGLDVFLQDLQSEFGKDPAALLGERTGDDKIEWRDLIGWLQDRIAPTE